MGTRYLFADVQTGADFDALATAVDAELGITAVEQSFAGGTLMALLVTGGTATAITDAATAVAGVGVDARYPYVA